MPMAASCFLVFQPCCSPAHCLSFLHPSMLAPATPLVSSCACACAYAPTVGSSAGPEGSIRWPLFKWAGGQEDRYFARITKGAIKVYQAPDMTLLDKKDLKLEGVLVSNRGGAGAPRGGGCLGECVFQVRQRVGCCVCVCVWRGVVNVALNSTVEGLIDTGRQGRPQAGGSDGEVYMKPCLLQTCLFPLTSMPERRY
jgi:hypothetical protein